MEWINVEITTIKACKCCKVSDTIGFEINDPFDIDDVKNEIKKIILVSDFQIVENEFFGIDDDNCLYLIIIEE